MDALDQATPLSAASAVQALDVLGDRLVAGCQDGTTSLYVLGERSHLRTLLRCTLPVRHVAFRPGSSTNSTNSGKGTEEPTWVAVVAEAEGDIRLVHAADPTRVRTLPGHARGVAACAFDPNGEYLVSLGAEGVVRVWDLASLDQQEATAPLAPRILDLPAFKAPANTRVQLAWHPSGKCVALPGPHKDILVLQRGGTWATLYRLKSSTLLGNVSLLAWSPNGTYLVCVCDGTQVVVWRPEHSRFVPVHTHTAEGELCSLQWQPGRNALILGDVQGRVLYCTDVVPADLPNPVAPVDATTTTTTPAMAAALHVSKAELAELFGESPPPTPKAAKSARPSPPKKLKRAMLDVEAEEDADDMAAMMEAAEADADADADLEADDDFIEDDDGAGYAEDLDNPDQLRKYQERSRKKAVSELQAAASLLRTRGGEGVGASSAAAIHGLPSSRGGFGEGRGTEGQEAFQPGSTPLKNDRRYLAFNLVGIVYSVDSTSHTTISVEYHDRSKRPFHFPDHSNYTLACLGDQGVVFASEAWSSANSSIYYKPMDSWASDAEWTMHLGPGENVKGLAMTRRGIVVLTDAGYVRCISFAGVQTHIRSVPGEVVACAGRGRWLLVVYANGAIYRGNQCMDYLLVDVEDMRVLRREGLPLSPGSLLAWIGISEGGIPASYDSHGILRMLFRHEDYAWVPVLDSKTIPVPALTSASTGEGAAAAATAPTTAAAAGIFHWAVDVTDTQFMCVVCKGYDKFPFFPRPLITEVPLQCPLLEMHGPTGVLEERLFRAGLMYHHAHEAGTVGAEGEADAAGMATPTTSKLALRKQETELDKTRLLLIQAACKAEKVQRALDLCAAMSSLKSIDGAIKLAVHHHLPALAERMNIVKESKYKKAQELEHLALQQQQEEEQAIRRPVLSSNAWGHQDRAPAALPQQMAEHQAIMASFGDGPSNTNSMAALSPTSTIRSSDQLLAAPSFARRPGAMEELPMSAPSLAPLARLADGLGAPNPAPNRPPVVLKNPFASKTKAPAPASKPGQPLSQAPQGKGMAGEKRRKTQGSLTSMFKSDVLQTLDKKCKDGEEGADPEVAEAVKENQQVEDDLAVIPTTAT